MQVKKEVERINGGVGKIKLPKEFNYVEAYLTLRCNLGCPYCINNNSGIKRNRKELSASKWLEALNKIDFGGVPVTLGGGEPTLHKEFFYLLRNLREDIKVDLLTNLQFDIEEFKRYITPKRFSDSHNPAYRPIRVSYHVKEMNAENLIDKVKNLQDSGFKIGIFGLNHPENIEANMLMSELARERQVYFFVKDFLGKYNGNLVGNYKYPNGLDGKLKSCLCRTKELLIAPDGEVYKCHRDLYHEEEPIGNILNPDFDIEHRFRSCKKYGNCNPCDIKLKTNRFLQAGICQVEIKDIE